MMSKTKNNVISLKHFANHEYQETTWWIKYKKMFDENGEITFVRLARKYSKETYPDFRFLLKNYSHIESLRGFINRYVKIGGKFHYRYNMYLLPFLFPDLFQKEIYYDWSTGVIEDAIDEIIHKYKHLVNWHSWDEDIKKWCRHALEYRSYKYQKTLYYE